jgi:glucose/arabinose dehydrogenase
MMSELLGGRRRIALAAIALLFTAASARAQLTSTVFVSGFTNPVAFVQDPSNATLQYVVEQGGVIKVIQNGTLVATPFLNLTSNVASGFEQGLLGLAFAPDYGSSRRFYVCFTNTAGHIVVARFLRSSGNPLVADTSTRFDFVWPDGQAFIFHPFTNHNGGNLAFGPDGFLYIGMGDGGSGNDPDHRAQDPASLLGKMLRLDVSVALNHAKGYIVPSSNPFVGQAGYLGEIWSFGLRNPWRWSFDDVAHGGNGAIVIGDVGQSAREEINYEPSGRGGRNYGWRNREGTLDNVTDRAPAFQPLIDPIYEYGRSVGTVVTGGVIYRGSALGATYRGRYFFADFGSRRVWSLALNINRVTGEATASGLVDHTDELGGPAALGNIASFGVDAAGEIYLCSFNGNIRRIVPAVRSPNPIINIDLPSQGAVVTQPFALAGWALDANATTGTGISTIHVWAFRGASWDYQTESPRFIGVPNFGNRPDVGAFFGSQFTPSGFGLAVSGLQPGSYNFRLFGWVDAIGGFGIVRTVDVTIAPSTRLTIDLPPNNSTVNQPFHLAGWAIDTAAPGGTGIDTIHVWAYPTTGGPPVFVGVPALGGGRPDVAAAFAGSRYTPSGYNMAAGGLPPGTYDLVVFAHSVVTNTFSAAQVVRVTVR